MSGYPRPEPRKLAEQLLWREANALADFMYEAIPDFPESEKWYTVSKLQGATVDMLFYISEALGGTLPSTTGADWSHARKSVCGLRTLYTFSGRQDFVKIDPEIVVRLDKMIVAIDEEVGKAHEWLEATNNADLDHWREKYKIWKKTDEL